jgi:thiamine pyrophosphate-dependent acetolactate synthase large subunit-like protein
MKCKTAIARILKTEVVEIVTGFPNNPLHEAIASEGIRLIMFRTEQVAAQAADGFTRASFGKRIGVTSMQAGPGLEVAFSGVREAYSDGVPILVLPSGEERRRISTDPFFDAVKHFQGITKWAESINFADRTPEIMRRAFTYLRTGRPRPVLVEVPVDVMNEDFDDAKFQYKAVKGVKPEGDPADIKDVARTLIAAKNPVIRAGQGILYACAWDELSELAELLQIPVFTTMNGKSAFPENHPLSLGAGGRAQPKAVIHFLNKADVVFAIGSSCTRHQFGLAIPDGKFIIQSTIDERDLSKDYLVEQAILGDAKLVLKQLISEVKKQIGPGGKRENAGVNKEIKAVKEEWLKEWMPKLTSDEVPINPYRVYWDLQKALDTSETIVTHDSGTPRDSLLPFWESRMPGGYIGFGKDHMLGAGMGLAMGAKLARPDKTVVNIGGEGAFGMVGMNFETAVRAKIAILTVVLNNGVLGGTLRANPIASERCGIQIESGNYSKVAEALGGYTERVERPQDIIPAVQRAKKVMASGQPALLEIMDCEETNVSIYH